MEDAAFPRGPVVAPRSDRDKRPRTEGDDDARRRRLDERSHDDVLFGERRETPKRRKKSSKAAAATTSHVLTAGGGAVSAGRRGAAPLVQSVSFARLSPGTKLWGVVRADGVREDHAVVSLPNMLTGFVRRRDENAPPLTDVLLPRQSLAVAVLSTSASDGRRIEVSPYPEHVNAGLTPSQLYLPGLSVRGRVVSVEDHGCVVSLGLGPSVTAFLRFDRAEGWDDDEETSSSSLLCPGRCLDFAVVREDKDSDKSNDDKRKRRRSAPTSHLTVQLSLPSRKKDAPRKLPLASPEGPSAVGGGGRSSKASHTIRSLTPGLLVECAVEAFAENGLLVTLLNGVFKGAIEEHHLGWFGEKNWREVFEDEAHVNEVTARVIVVDSVSKIVRLSLLRHVVERRAPAPVRIVNVGDVMDGSRLVRVDGSYGALLRHGEEVAEEKDDDDNDKEETHSNKRKEKRDPKPLHPHPLWRFRHRYGSALSPDITSVAPSPLVGVYVHASKAFDEDEANNDDDDRRDVSRSRLVQRFASKPKLRVLSVDSCLVENLVTATAAPSVVSARVLSHADLVPGAIHKRVDVARLVDAGAVVDLGNHVRALCPTIHLEKEALRRLESAKNGALGTLDVRCLSVDPARKRATVTARRALVKDAHDHVLATADDPASLHRIATGLVTRVDAERGVTMEFYNGVRGRCGARRLADETGVEDATERYRVGQTLACRVVRIGRRTVELSTDTTKEALERERSARRERGECPLKVGTRVPAKAMRITRLVRGDGEIGHAVVFVSLVKVSSGDDDDQKREGEVECRLPYEQLRDAFGKECGEKDIVSFANDLAERCLAEGERCDRDAVVLVADEEPDDDGEGASFRPPVLSLREGLVEAVAADATPFLPTSTSRLHVGARVAGYVVRVDPRYGAFVRFAGRLTGLVPKSHRGTEETLHDTLTCRVVRFDPSARPPRIVLKRSRRGNHRAVDSATTTTTTEVKVGDVVGDVVVEDANFYRLNVRLLGDEHGHDGRRKRTLRARIHVTMYEDGTKEASTNKKKKKNRRATKNQNDDGERRVTDSHPFRKLKRGSVVPDVVCVAREVKDGVTYLDLTNRAVETATRGDDSTTTTTARRLPTLVARLEDLALDQEIDGVVADVRRKGVRVYLSPGLSSLVPALELSDDPDVLNDLSRTYAVGDRIRLRVAVAARRSDDDVKREVVLSARPGRFEKPRVGGAIVARVDRAAGTGWASENDGGDGGRTWLTLECRGGYVARCCVTELAEPKDWVNLPLGRPPRKEEEEEEEEKQEKGNVVTDEEEEEEEDEKELGGDETKAENDEEKDEKDDVEDTEYPDGKYFRCKVLNTKKGSKVLDVSLRKSRLDGDLEDEKVPAPKDVVRAYVVSTNKKGCYLRLSRTVKGRILLKELSDGYLPDPVKQFPTGRLVECKVKKIVSKDSSKKENKGETLLDLDGRESSVLETSRDKLTFDDIESGSKHRGVITRTERYGVFVRLENSDVSGLCHVSKLSDKHLPKGGAVGAYDPGDLVKAVVLEVDKDKKRLQLGLKASYFEDDEDSDDDDEDDSSSEDESEDDDVDDAIVSDEEMKDADDDFGSDDENFASKLASKIQKSGDDESESGSESDTDDESSDEESSSEDEDNGRSKVHAMDTDVGFDWDSKKNATSVAEESSDSESSSDEEENTKTTKGGKSRNKSALRRREEKKIAQRESALAEGILDENPETRADFERLIASNPNSSEHWMKYMAYYLSLADIESARKIANRAFDRIEFRQEGEKLNVWTALLTLESRYGSPRSFQDAVDRACQHNNPKKVYLRVCEIVERDAESRLADSTSSSSDAVKKQSDAVKNTDNIYSKMCQKFKSKKSVWLAHLRYLLKNARHHEAHDLLKRSLKSLPGYKHVETMSKFAQLEFELGSVERARTIFDGLLLKYPKRMDILFVYVDKEVKADEIEAARSIFKRVVDPKQSCFKFSDKQMKSLFKKWYRMEEANGTVTNTEDVKKHAKDYVERSSSMK